MISWEDLEIILNELNTSIQKRDYHNARNFLMEAVPGYKPKNEIDDPMFLDR